MAKRVHPFTQPTAAGDLPLEIVQPPKPSADSLARANAAIGEWLIVDRRGYEACRDDCRGPKLQLDILAEHVARAIDEAVAAEHVFTASWADKCLMLERALIAERNKIAAHLHTLSRELGEVWPEVLLASGHGTAIQIACDAARAERKRAQAVVEALGHTKIADAAAGSSGPQ